MRIALFVFVFFMSAVTLRAEPSRVPQQEPMRVVLARDADGWAALYRSIGPAHISLGKGGDDCPAFINGATLCEVRIRGNRLEYRLAKDGESREWEPAPANPPWTGVLSCPGAAGKCAVWWVWLNEEGLRYFVSDGRDPLLYPWETENGGL